jgi:hypothetical protein
LVPAGPRHRPAGAFEVDCRGPPWLANRRGAAGKRNRLEPLDAFEACEVAAEQFAAPERAVGAIAGAVEDECQRRTGLAVFGETRCGVSVVMLHADELGFLLERPFRCEVFGVEVVSDPPRADVQHLEEQREVAVPA